VSLFTRRLRREAENWITDGLVDRGTADRLIAASGRSGSRQHTAAILGTGGGALIALGLILLVASNWQMIHPWVKIGVLVALMWVAYALGVRFRVCPGHRPRIGDGLMLLGGLLFLSGIALVSQIYQLNSRPDLGLLFWWAGTLVLSLATGSKPLYFGVLLGGVIWFGMALVEPASILFLGPDGLNNDGTRLMGAQLLAGTFLMGTGAFMERGRLRDLAGITFHSGLLLVHLVLFLFAYAELRVGSNAPAVPLGPLTFFTILAVFGLVGLVARPRHDLWAPAVLGLVPAILVILLPDSGMGAPALAISSMVVLAALDCGLVWRGSRTGRTGWVNLGFAFIAINLICIYGKYLGTMLSGGLFFLVTGLVVLAIGVAAESQRRRLMRRMADEEGET
jgi:uncharacterized membrane protein